MLLSHESKLLSSLCHILDKAEKNQATNVFMLVNTHRHMFKGRKTDLCWGLHHWETPGRCSWPPCRTRDEAEWRTWSPDWAGRSGWWYFSRRTGLHRRKRSKWHALEWEAQKEGVNFYQNPNYKFTSGACGFWTLTLFLWLALHFQVHGGEAELVAILSRQLLLLQAVAHTEATAHSGHLAVELLPCNFVVKA